MSYRSVSIGLLMTMVGIISVAVASTGASPVIHSLSSAEASRTDPPKALSSVKRSSAEGSPSNESHTSNWSAVEWPVSMLSRPAASDTQLSMFAAPKIDRLQPDASRTPLVPIVADKTVLAKLPPTMGVTSAQAGISSPVRTSAWWSSGMLDTWPAPVFALPIKGVFSATGLTISTPLRRVLDKAIISDDSDPLRIFANTPASGATPIIAGDWDVTYRIRDAAAAQFDATFIQGSPFVFIRPFGSSLTAALPEQSRASPVDCKKECGSALLIQAPAATYLLVAPIQHAFTIRGGNVSIRFEAGKSLVTIAAIAPGSDHERYLGAAMRPYIGTKATYAVTASDVSTTFRFPTATIMGILPHQYLTLSYAATDNGPRPFIEGDPDKLIGTFETIRGPVRLFSGKGFRTMLPRPSILPSLPPVPSLQSDDSMRELLQAEIARNETPSGDVYSIVKLLYRTAALAELADTMGAVALRDRAVAQARYSLAQSCSAAPASPLKFAFDPRGGGIIALPPAFGSEHYNDHHFHYGYVLHAAAIVARFDPAFLGQYGDCFRLLARDIASSNRNDPSFPYLRYSDPYGGHSWANGLTGFGDATNQESASEAMHAWYSLALFGRTAGNKNLENLGVWLYAQESQAARIYWLNAEKSSGAVPKDFPYPMLSILWGGKADYATFFDGSDAAIRGIQFFPVTTALLPIVTEEIVSRVVAPAARSAQNIIWKSSLTLVEMLVNPQARIATDAPIDPGLSRSYVEYWQQALPILGQPTGSTQNCPGYVFKNGAGLLAAVYRFPLDPVTCNFTVGLKAVHLDKLTQGWNLREIGP